MIYQREIIQKANDWKILPNTVDKDYALGHFLNCFFNFQNNKKLFAFKGGTCLRKCYFPDYRFSEDLDFTLLDEDFTLDKEWIEQIAYNCTISSGIQFHPLSFKEIYSNDSKKGYQYIIAFWGANHNQNKPPPPFERWHTKIEIDISFDEKVFSPVNKLSINHAYSDINKLTSQTIPVYSLQEIFTEKVRAFYQRSYKAPRDFYDVWYLLNHYPFENWRDLKEILLKKCEAKNITIDRELFNDNTVYKSVENTWERSIAHQLPSGSLPKFDVIWRYLKNNLFNNLFQK